MPHDGSNDDAERALQLAYSYLNRRERTASEVRQQLQRKGVDHVTAEQTVATLLEQGMLDDHRFARLFTEDKRELEQWGAERIRRVLLGRGIDPDTVAAALIEHSADGRAPFESELDRALVLLRRRFPSPPRDRRERDRALGLLVRKGYDFELAVDALAAYARGP